MNGKALSVAPNTTLSDFSSQGNKVRVLFCGDLNSTPDTGVFQLLARGKVEADHESWTGCEYGILSVETIYQP